MSMDILGQFHESHLNGYPEDKYDKILILTANDAWQHGRDHPGDAQILFFAQPTLHVSGSKQVLFYAKRGDKNLGHRGSTIIQT